MATSTCEAELIAAARAVKEAPWFEKLLADMCGVFRLLILCVDSEAAIVLLRNPAAGLHHTLLCTRHMYGQQLRLCSKT